MYDMLTIKSKKVSADMVLIKICENILIVCFIHWNGSCYGLALCLLLIFHKDDDKMINIYLEQWNSH